MSRTPRVLQVVLSLNPGGTERLVVDIVSRLEPDLPMAVCCLDEEGAWAEGLKARGIAVSALGRGAGFRPALGRAVARVAARHRASVVHCHQYSPFVYGCLARLWQPGLRVIFTEHGRLSDAPPSFKRRVANTVLARVPREVVAVSADLRRHLVAEGFPAGRVSVVYNGIDVGPLPDCRARTDARRELSVPNGSFVVGTIARLDPVKHLETLIHAVIVAHRRSPVILVVIGDGPERGRLEALAAELDATACIRFLGHRDDARAVLAGCDLYANSSISEGISLTILEAMAAGLPVVATEVGGTPEIVDRTCGRLVPSRDPETLAAELVDLAEDRALRQQLGAAARRRVETQFTIERMVGQYREAYCRISASREADRR